MLLIFSAQTVLSGNIPKFDFCDCVLYLENPGFVRGDLRALLVDFLPPGPIKTYHPYRVNTNF
jgi:hypothetical protein